jgi:hypothetical protein
MYILLLLVMVLCYLGLNAYLRVRGGYKPIDLSPQST